VTRVARPAERWRKAGGEEVEIIAWSDQTCGSNLMRPTPGHGATKCRLVVCDDGYLMCSKTLGETGTLIDWPGRGA